MTNEITPPTAAGASDGLTCCLHVGPSRIHYGRPMAGADQELEA
jgi:hypothetical protein